MSIFAMQASLHRPHPVHADSPAVSGKKSNFLTNLFRTLSASFFLGLAPPATREKLLYWQESHRRALPNCCAAFS